MTRAGSALWLLRIGRFLCVCVFGMATLPALALGDPERPEPGATGADLRFFHAPDCVNLEAMRRRLEGVASDARLSLQVYDTSDPESLRGLLVLEKERGFQRYDNAVLFAGRRILVGHGEILPFLEDLGAGRIGLHDPAPTLNDGPPAGNTAILPAGAEPSGGSRLAWFPPFGSWVVAVALVLLGLFVGLGIGRAGFRARGA